jgi:thiol-disulfide isomerase/thioredoxin
MSGADAAPRRSGAFNVFLMAACAALSVLVVLLAVQNLRLKKQLSQHPGGGIPENALHAGERFEGLSIVDWDEQSKPLEFGKGENRTLVLIFSSTCGACELTFPIWEQIVGGLGESSDIRVVGVQTDASHDAPKDQGGLMTESLTFPVFKVDYDASPIMARIPGVPATVLVDATGVVQKVWFGAPNDDVTEEMRSVLR